MLTIPRVVFASMAAAGVVSCNDGIAPVQAIGRYELTVVETAQDWTPLTPIAYPFPGNSSAVVFDSLFDTITLQAGGSYQEQGTFWGHSIAGFPYIAPIRANGTYQTRDSAMTLIPSDSSLVSGGPGTLFQDGTLRIVRYPGTWKFTRQD